MPEPMGDKPEVLNFTQGQITVGNRAPRSSDKGLLWIYDAGSAATLYCRSLKTGTWYAQS